MEDYIAQVHAQKRKNIIVGVSISVVCVLLRLFIFVDNSDKGAVLDEVTALNCAPALALTEDELALAETILDYDDFRNALNYDLVDNSTAFSIEDTWDIYSSVIPENATVTEVAVAGAVVIIDYTQPQHRIILEYADADRSGTVDQIRKTLTPIIDGVSTGRYQVDQNLSTGKTVYTYRSN